jgi:hypothetical protein
VASFSFDASLVEVQEVVGGFVVMGCDAGREPGLTERRDDGNWFRGSPHLRTYGVVAPRADKATQLSIIDLKGDKFWVSGHFFQRYSTRMLFLTRSSALDALLD